MTGPDYPTERPVYADRHGHEQHEPGSCKVCGAETAQVRTEPTPLAMALEVRARLSRELHDAEEARRADPSQGRQRVDTLMAAYQKAEERAVAEALVAAGGDGKQARRLLGAVGALYDWLDAKKSTQTAK